MKSTKEQNTMKKVLLFQHYGGVGGSGIGLLTTINALRDKYEVVVYCSAQPNSLIEYYLSLGINVKPIDFKFPFFSYYNGGAPWYTRSFWKPSLYYSEAKKGWDKIYATEHPDIVIVNSMCLSWFYRLTKNQDCKIICHVRETLPSRYTVFGRRMLRNLEHFDGVMYISAYDQKYMRLKKPQQTIVRDAIRNDENIGLNRIDSINKKGLFVGGSDPIKGLEILLESMKYMQCECKINIAGNIQSFLIDDKIPIPKMNFLLKNWYKRIKKMFLDPRIRQKINIVGHQNNITNLFKEADFVVFPSTTPHQSRPIIEAGEFYKPAIVSDYKQTAENIIDGHNGFTFTPQNPKALAKAIDKLYSNTENIKRLGINNHKIILEKHTYEVVAEALLSFLEKIVD